MSVSNKLFERFKNVKRQPPDKQLLLFSSYLIKHVSSIEVLLAQFKWCLDNDVKDECYKVLRQHLNGVFGEYEIDLLIRRYRQVKLNENKTRM